jgi:Fe-S oxidoreductase
MCGGCDAMDKGIRDAELIKMFQWMRAEYVRRFGPIDEHKGLVDSIKQYDNVWLQPRARKNSWVKELKDLKIKDLNTEKAEVLLFVGCTYGLSAEMKNTIINIATLLRQNDVDFGILGNKEMCCGSPVSKIGVVEEFERLGSSNIKHFNELGIKTLVTPCAGCYGTIRVEYDELQEKKDFEVLHIAEYLERLVQVGQIEYRKELPLTVTWHDPCHMGRLSRPYVPGKELDGVYEQPRNILKSIPGLELAEMERIKEYAWCCGGGGGVYTGFKDFAQWTSRERLIEAKDTGASLVVTSCPWCESNLRAGVIGMEEKIGVKNLIDLMTEAL